MNTWVWMRSIVGLMLLSAGVLAAPDDSSRSPLGCRDQGYEFKFNALSIMPTIEGDRQSLYFVFNRSNKPVQMHQMLDDNDPDGVYLNHVINAQQWSVLATNERELKFICAVDATTSSLGNVVDCSETIKVCEFARVKFGLNNRGNYWFLNSNTRNGALSDVTHYGIIAR